MDARGKKPDIRYISAVVLIKIFSLKINRVSIAVNVHMLQASIPIESLMIASESEAAVLLTKEQELCRQEKNGKVELLPFTPQSSLMIIDLGGKNKKKITFLSFCIIYFIL